MPQPRETQLNAFALATRRLEEFTQHVGYITDGAEAEETAACDAFLNLGIEAWRWLKLAEKQLTWRRMQAGQKRRANREWKSLCEMRRQWLTASVAARCLAGTQLRQGRDLEYVDEFLGCEAETKAELGKAA